jgi:bidirectional [NiFe] hydrogenase diaphorase subunit
MTPVAAPPASSVTLKIDGKDVSASVGQTVLDVARENDIYIPALCYIDGLSVWGGCRLCVVEIVGSPKLAAACSLQCSEGLDVVTDSPKLQQYRRTILEMLFCERNHVCAVCVSNGHCELQSLAQTLGVTHVHLPYLYPRMEVDSSHDRFRMDQNRCILCTRCVRVCDEVEGAHTIDVKGRGVAARIIHDLDEPWGASETCTSCGKCVHVCPVGAKTEKGTAVAEMNKRRQFLPYLTTMREARS